MSSFATRDNKIKGHLQITFGFYTSPFYLQIKWAKSYNTLLSVISCGRYIYASERICFAWDEIEVEIGLVLCYIYNTILQCVSIDWRKVFLGRITVNFL